MFVQKGFKLKKNISQVQLCFWNWNCEYHNPCYSGWTNYSPHASKEGILLEISHLCNFHSRTSSDSTYSSRTLISPKWKEAERTQNDENRRETPRTRELPVRYLLLDQSIRARNEAERKWSGTRRVIVASYLLLFFFFSPVFFFLLLLARFFPIKRSTPEASFFFRRCTHGVPAEFYWRPCTYVCIYKGEIPNAG